MRLVAFWQASPDELRADLQQHFGIDIEKAMAGEHSAAHVAACASQLPLDARVHVALDKDAQWTQELVLLASIVNLLQGLIWGMADPKKRGSKPQPIGPSYMTKAQMRSLPARAMSVDELMAELSKPRTDNG